jgi:ABC-type bacteriocin/lantibiotic exporter with double-glycine peptidase domain
MMDILSRFAKGRTTILIEHHPEMLAMADREIVIDRNMAK